MYSCNPLDPRPSSSVGRGMTRHSSARCTVPPTPSALHAASIINVAAYRAFHPPLSTRLQKTMPAHRLEPSRIAAHAAAPLCFAPHHVFLPKPHPVSITTARRRHHSVPQPRSALPRAAPPLQARLDTAASNYLTVDVFSPHARPPPHAPRAAPNPVVIIPGYGATAREYLPMAAALRDALGPAAHVTVAPITLSTWLAPAAGRPITPVLRRVHAAVRSASRRCGAAPVHLVAHSAGGWVARIYLGDVPYPPGSSLVWGGARLVSKLICLGTPHRSDEPVTRRNMRFVNDHYPGAYHRHVHYVNVVGSACSVAPLRRAAWRFWEPHWFPRLSYRLTDSSIGRGAAQGDGIVPLSSAFLPGAHNVCLSGIWHSPSSGGAWYGHPDAIKFWSCYLHSQDETQSE